MTRPRKNLLLLWDPFSIISDSSSSSSTTGSVEIKREDNFPLLRLCFFFSSSSNRHFRLCVHCVLVILLPQARITKAKTWTTAIKISKHLSTIYNGGLCLVGFSLPHAHAFTSLHFPVSAHCQNTHTDPPTSGLIRFFYTCVCVFSRLLRPIMNFLSKRTVMFFLSLFFSIFRPRVGLSSLEGREKLIQFLL